MLKDGRRISVTCAVILDASKAVDLDLIQMDDFAACTSGRNTSYGEVRGLYSQAVHDSIYVLLPIRPGPFVPVVSIPAEDSSHVFGREFEYSSIVGEKHRTPADQFIT